MKRISALTVFLLSFICLQVSAQETILTDINYGQLEKYIQLAKESYPKRKVATAQMESAKINIPLAKVQYLEIFNASYFYRPEKQDVVNINNPYSVNGFQFGINLNLGSLLQKPFLVKKAKADYKVAQMQSQDFDLFLENEVKRRYYTYLMTLSQLKIRTATAQDNKNISEVTKHKFERGELSLDVYNASRILVSSSNNDKIQYEVNYLLAKDALEEIIGQKLTEVK